MPIRLSHDARLIHFPSTDGIQLEGRLTRREPGRAAIFCHPHPLYGGSMLTPVIMTAEQVFLEAGYTTLAFNFRFAFLRSAACRIALIAGSHDEFCDRGRLETFCASLPRKAWLRLLETDHFFGGVLEELTQACRDAITWAEEK
jgi:alpha/beta superfamily hydrolase